MKAGKKFRYEEIVSLVVCLIIPRKIPHQNMPRYWLPTGRWVGPSPSGVPLALPKVFCSPIGSPHTKVADVAPEAILGVDEMAAGQR